MKKKLLVSLLVTVALICTCALAASAVGTLADDGIYEISTAEELYAIATGVAANAKTDEGTYVRDCAYRLMNDIDMSGISAQTPIGTAKYAFRGSFDGQNHTISGIELSNSAGNCALFGRVAKNGAVPATIENLIIEGNVTSSGSNVGGLIAQVADSAIVRNCTNWCNVSYTGNVIDTTKKHGTGGIVGRIVAASGTLEIANCTNTGSISGSKGVGGILGRSDVTTGSITVTGCTNRGVVTATISDASGCADVGGIAGFDYGEKNAATRHLFSGCTNFGTVAFAKLEDYDFSSFTKGFGFQGVGGIIGRTQTTGIEVTGCYNGGKVTSDGRDANGTSGDSYAMVIVGKSPVAPKNSNNYYKPGAGAMNSVKAIAVGLTEESTTAAIWQDGNATVRYITRLTVDDAAAVEKYGIMIAKVDDNVDAKYAALTDSFEGTETTYAVDLVGIPETARDINIYAWAYVNLAGGVQIALPIDPVTVNRIITG